MNGFTAIRAARGYADDVLSASEHPMVVQFDKTMTEGDFPRPLLDPAEERVAREARGEMDLDVEGLTSSLLGRLLALVAGRRA